MAKILYLIIFVLTACAHEGARSPAAINKVHPMVLEQVDYAPLDVKLRMGFMPESESLRGCVLYLQGLADSVVNHDPLFNALSDAGFRVIYFDYMGQGGSEGKMNNTRVQVEMPRGATSQMRRNYESRDKFYEISEQAEFAWGRYKDVKSPEGQDCNGRKKLVLGWSTGGLAAYRMAYERRADAVVLIAPGIHPNWFVGESAHGRVDRMLSFREVITERTLTRNRFADEVNPHIDPVKPASPAYAPQFAVNLLGVAKQSERWKIHRDVPGLVFLSGVEDSYVDREATVNTLENNAAHFEIRKYDGALHELDNELPAVAQDLRHRTIEFFLRVTE